MGLAWQQGPLARSAIGQFLVPEPLPPRLLYAEPLRRRLRARYAGTWIAQSDDVVLLHEPARYPVAYFPRADILGDVLEVTERRTRHQDLGETAWYSLTSGEQTVARAAWEHVALPRHAGVLEGRIAFAWHALDGFYEEDERILGHAADPYHRIDIRQTSRHLVVHAGETIVAESDRPLVLYESGFAPRWYVPREDVGEHELTAVSDQTFCPYKGLCSYYDIGQVSGAAWSYVDAYPEVQRIGGLVSFEPDKVTVQVDGVRLELAPGQRVVPHGPDRDLTAREGGR
jgi:uncharacterized protein (DUF427 family)